MLAKTIEYFNLIFSNKNFIKYSKISISIFFYIIIINIIYKNIGFLSILRNINYSYIFYLIALIFLRILIKSAQQQYLYKIDSIEIPLLESIKIYIYKLIGNNFMNFGSIYKISYLKANYNIALTRYMKLNTALTTTEVFVLIYLFLYLLVINNVIFLEIQTLTLILLIPLTIIFLLKYKFGLFNLEIFKNIKRFVLLKLISLTLLFHFINLLIYKTYFETLFLNKEIIQSTIYYLVGYFTNLISLTPGNIGYFEFIQIQAVNFHSLNVSEILAVSTLNRILAYMIILLLFLYTKFAKN